MNKTTYVIKYFDEEYTVHPLDVKRLIKEDINFVFVTTDSKDFASDNPIGHMFPKYDVYMYFKRPEILFDRFFAPSPYSHFRILQEIPIIYLGKRDVGLFKRLFNKRFWKRSIRIYYFSKEENEFIPVTEEEYQSMQILGIK